MEEIITFIALVALLVACRWLYIAWAAWRNTERQRKYLRRRAPAKVREESDLPDIEPDDNLRRSAGIYTGNASFEEFQTLQKGENSE